MAKKLVFLLILVAPSFMWAHEPPFWSKTGHRVIGEIAQDYLKGGAKRKITKLLDGRSLAAISNFGDEIKADTLYRKYSAWHYVNLPPDKGYDAVTPSNYGDLVVGVRECIASLKNKELPDAERAFYLKMLVHLIGDLHQPMHVGRAEDKGGNDFQLQWFGKGTNLHKIWDANLVEDNGMSYTEMAQAMPKPTKQQLQRWQAGQLLDWVHESRDLATEVYNGVSVGEKLYYRYGYDWWPVAELQLQKGGVRLAKLLNELF